MTDLVLKRIYKGKEYTIGKLYRKDNKGNLVYICDTLEDTVRNKACVMINKFIKVFGKTAIPYGRYELTRTMSNRFKKILPLLLKVPHFEGVRIHSGNTAEDTEGCILPGRNTVKGKVTNSRVCFSEVDLIIKKGLEKGKVFITITD